MAVASRFQQVRRSMSPTLVASDALDDDDGRISSPLLHITGLSLMWLSVTTAFSAIVEYLYGDPDGVALLLATALFAVTGYLLMRFTKVDQLDTAGSFAAVGGTWLIVSLAGAIPYILAGTFMHIDDAIFESVSGFSCTGSTVFFNYNPNISDQGHGILMYRQLTNWVGGMGIVLLAITVLPSLGRGGLGLIGAEAPGPSSEHLVPRLNETAKRLWYVYLAVTGLLAVAFLAAGMGPFDAFAHGLSTAATGGFSTQDSSIGGFDSVLIEVVVMLGMVIGGINFALHYRFGLGDWLAYFRDREFRVYIGFVIAGVTLVVGLLWLDSDFGFGDSLRSGAFNTIALATSTGFGNATGAGSPGDFVQWIPGPQVVLIFFMFLGASSGSTSGGVKVIRLQILFRQVHRFLQQIRHRNLVLPVKVNGRRVADHLVEKVMGFIVLHITIVVIGILVVTALGADLMTAVGGVVGSMGNSGPALGEVGPANSFIDGFSRPARMVLALLMLVGRLEIFPMVLMLVTPRRMFRRLRPRKQLS